MNTLSPMCAGSSGLTVGGRYLKPLAFSLLLTLFLAVFALPALAQDGTILGTVTDPTGASVPNATVTISSTETGAEHSLTTNSQGQYVGAELAIGHYSVRAVAAGFKSTERRGIVLAVGDRLRIDFSLEVGSTQEQITVEANAVAVQTDTGEVSSVVTGQQISQLATNGRSVFSLEALTPGASSIQADFMIPTSGNSDFNVSFNGQRVSHNLWVIDGGESDDRGGGGGSIVLPSEDAIAEFRTMTSNYSAEYGLSSAGTVSMVLKSGTKKFHATAFYFGRNDALDARNYFNPAKDPDGTPNPVFELRFDDFGFNVGGPVSFHPNTSNPKTFFFYNMEWRRYVAGGSFNQTVPLASEYPNAAGDVVLPSSLPTGAAINAVVPSNIAITAPTCTGLTPGSPFPNNTIPACAVSPNAAALLGAGIFPQPTSGDAFIGGGKQPLVGKEELARIDHQFTDKFSIFGHWISDQEINTTGETQWSGDNDPAVFNTYSNPSFAATVHATYTIHPNLLNEVAFNYDGNRIHILPAGVFAAPSAFTFNRIFGAVSANVDNRIPDIHLAQATGTDYTVNWLPWNNTANDYQVRDDLSWVRGAHQFKFGAGWAIYKKAQDYFAETQGGFTFNGSFTTPTGCTTSSTNICGYDYADFILGDASNYSENAYKGTGHWNAISPDAYIQDNWRATHRLTLNLGLRWDGIPHTYEANNDSSNFYPNLYNPANAPAWVPGSNFSQICGVVGSGGSLPAGCAAASPGLGSSPIAALSSLGNAFYLNGMSTGGQNGIPKGLANPAWWNFGPRFGFAYDVTGSGKTVIRGGYGLMYERIQGNDMYNGATNVPFGLAFGTTDVELNDPHNPTNGGAPLTVSSVPIVPGGVVGINRSYPAPRTSSYSAGVQRAVGSRALISVSYVGSVDRHESYWNEINLPPQACLGSNGCAQTGTPFNGLVPYQGYSSIKQAYNGANSHYNSLQAELRGQITRDLNLQAAYTLSKAIDPTTGSSGNGWDLDYVTNPYQNWRYDVGPSVLDRRNVAFFNFVYDIPLLKNSSKHLLKTAIGGWQLSGIVTAESGAPYNLGINNANVASVFPGGDIGNRPNLTGTISYPKTIVTGSHGNVTGLQWANPSAFSLPACATGPDCWGNLGFDALTGPGRDNWNLSLFKRFIISETRGSEFQFRAESFNTWNHTQFGCAGQNGCFSNNFGSGNQLQITGAFDPRVFQLGAKLIF